jgi:hypothetical protein
MFKYGDDSRTYRIKAQNEEELKFWSEQIDKVYLSIFFSVYLFI